MPWTTPEKHIIRQSFRESIQNGKLPSFEHIREIKDLHSKVLRNRTVPTIKTYISNQIRSYQQGKTLSKLFYLFQMLVEKIQFYLIGIWSTPEKAAARKTFKHYLDNQKLPPVKLCHEAVQNIPELHKRTGQQVKSWIDNQNKREQRLKAYAEKKERKGKHIKKIF